jgi:hypothetical protein
MKKKRKLRTGTLIGGVFGGGAIPTQWVVVAPAGSSSIEIDFRLDEREHQYILSLRTCKY